VGTSHSKTSAIESAHATPPRLHSCTATSRSAPTSSSFTTQLAGLWISPYNGPYQVLSRREKALRLLVRRRPVTVSTARVKPAYVLNGTDRGNSTFNPPVNATPAVASPAIQPQPSTRPTCSGYHIHFTAHFIIRATISRGGGDDLGTSHSEPSTAESALTTAFPTPIG
jgi:hypothetical protein